MRDWDVSAALTFCSGSASEFDDTDLTSFDEAPSPRESLSPPSSPKTPTRRPTAGELLPRLPPLPEAEPVSLRHEPLYVVIISLHGLVRSREMELGKDRRESAHLASHPVASLVALTPLPSIAATRAAR